MKNFDSTPSFYNSEEVFTKFLKSTSYYKALQESLLSIVKAVNPKSIVELGSATGSSTFFLAEKFKDKNLVGYDFRENIVKEAQNLNKFNNVKFACLDMVEFAKKETDADFIFMLHSFHHIVDPLENKIDFLKNLYQNIKTGAYVCIMEAYIPENIGLDDAEKIVDLWRLRSEEGYASTFWSAMKDKPLTKENIEIAESIADFSRKNEYEAGLLVAKRDNEYLIQKSWLKKQAENVGFKVLICHDVNAIGEGVVLLQK